MAKFKFKSVLKDDFYSVQRGSVFLSLFFTVEYLMKTYTSLIAYIKFLVLCYGLLCSRMLYELRCKFENKNIEAVLLVLIACIDFLGSLI